MQLAVIRIVVRTGNEGIQEMLRYAYSSGHGNRSQNRHEKIILVILFTLYKFLEIGYLRISGFLFFSFGPVLRFFFRFHLLWWY